MFSLSNLGEGSCTYFHDILLNGVSEIFETSCTYFHDILLNGVSEIFETRQDNWCWPVSLYQALHVVWAGFVPALNHFYNHKNDVKCAKLSVYPFL